MRSGTVPSLVVSFDEIGNHCRGVILSTKGSPLFSNILLSLFHLSLHRCPNLSLPRLILYIYIDSPAASHICTHNAHLPTMFPFKTKDKTRRETRQRLDDMRDQLGKIDDKLTTLINNHLKNTDPARHELEDNSDLLLHYSHSNRQAAQPVWLPAAPPATTREEASHNAGPQHHPTEAVLAQPAPAADNRSLILLLVCAFLVAIFLRFFA
ncbi:hypothetical protein B0T21DRAFT_359457 [Apiosordaria backusii]|uniref:Uncharacterized protein n=1 Tax=Apiosordaria backusii TaxID=314023 RepID=A0AA40K495_9PEZI|nr:hypothetical protein B0T21DRAFT_359457 [Apiosordaria backusii]